jgi:hypothetical protein
MDTRTIEVQLYFQHFCLSSTHTTRYHWIPCVHLILSLYLNLVYIYICIYIYDAPPPACVRHKYLLNLHGAHKYFTLVGGAFIRLSCGYNKFVPTVATFPLFGTLVPGTRYCVCRGGYWYIPGKYQVPGHW